VNRERFMQLAMKADRYQQDAYTKRGESYNVPYSQGFDDEYIYDYDDARKLVALRREAELAQFMADREAERAMKEGAPVDVWIRITPTESVKLTRYPDAEAARFWFENTPRTEMVDSEYVYTEREVR
jgi:hypothetical protein